MQRAPAGRGGTCQRRGFAITWCPNSEMSTGCGNLCASSPCEGPLIVFRSTDFDKHQPQPMYNVYKVEEASVRLAVWRPVARASSFRAMWAGDSKHLIRSFSTPSSTESSAFDNARALYTRFDRAPKNISTAPRKRAGRCTSQELAKKRNPRYNCSRAQARAKKTAQPPTGALQQHRPTFLCTGVV